MQSGHFGEVGQHSLKKAETAGQDQQLSQRCPKGLGCVRTTLRTDPCLVRLSHLMKKTRESMAPALLPPPPQRPLCPADPCPPQTPGPSHASFLVSISAEFLPGRLRTCFVTFRVPTPGLGQRGPSDLCSEPCATASPWPLDIWQLTLHSIHGEHHYRETRWLQNEHSCGKHTHKDTLRWHCPQNAV